MAELSGRIRFDRFLPCPRSLYIAQHQTAVIALNCMDGPINISVATRTPAGIIPLRNLGVRFNMGWPYFAEVLAGHVREMAGQGRRTLALITYHYSPRQKEPITRNSSSSPLPSMSPSKRRTGRQG